MQNKFIPNDFFTHQQSWRKALEIAEANAKVEAPDVDDKTYWQHELAAFDRAYAELKSKTQQQYNIDLGSVLIALENAIADLKGIIYTQNLKPYIEAKNTLATYIQFQANTILPANVDLPGKILPQGSNSVNNLINAGISSLTHLPDVHKTKMVQALNAFKSECVPAAVSFEDIDACIEPQNLILSVEEKIDVMKGLIALSRAETAKEQIVVIANHIVLQRQNQSSEDFDPDATLPSMGSNY